MFYLIVFTLSWVIWLIFADKKRWRELLATGLVAVALGAITDNMVHHFRLWDYPTAKSIRFWTDLSDDFGIYVVVVYLFIQWLPQKKTLINMLIYWFLWTGLTIGVEYFYLATGHMKHLGWWCLWYSYAADWFLFSMFYLSHKIFKFEKLSS